MRLPVSPSAVAIWAVVALAFGCLSPGAGALDILPRSFSRTRQFVIYAKDSSLRGAIGTLAEDTKEGVLSALGLKDEWRVPIVIDLRAPEAGNPDGRVPVRWTLGQTGSGLKIELDLLIGEVNRGTHIRDEFVRGLLLELAYRGHDRLPAGQPYTAPPPWLVVGLSAYLENLEDGVSASMFGALLPTTQALSINDFLGQDPANMDSTSRAVYRAYAYNLVCLIIGEIEGGRGGLVNFIRGLPDMTYDAARGAGALGRQFKEFASPASLDKWWTLGLGRLSANDRYQIFTVRESETRLEAALTIKAGPDFKHKQPAKIFAITDFKEFSKRKQNKILLQPAKEALMLLLAQANPLYRPIVAEYEDLIAHLARGYQSTVEDKLNALAEQRRDMLKYREEISDYMNWYEATQAATQSGSFDDYFHTVRQLDARDRIHRPDAISVYLDALGTDLR